MLPRVELLSALALPIGIGMIVQGSYGDVPAGAHLPAPASVVQSQEPVSFSEQILPIFQARCTECHSDESAELGLNLSTYEGAMAGSDYGTVIEPGNVAGSLLIDMIESGDMPEEGDPVPPEEIALIKTWIEEGAQNN